MKSIWDEENKIRLMIRVELALLKSLAKHGFVSSKEVEELEKKCETVKVDRIKEIEAEIKHDIMALVKAMSEVAEGDAGKWIHFGATSNDIIDTATALQLRDSLTLIKEKLVELLRELVKKAKEHIDTICLGRTHGQAAIPTTYGFRFAVWASEIMRHLERLSEVEKRVVVGQITGAVGTQAAYGDMGESIEAEAMQYLEIKSVDIATQIIPRDLYGEYVMFLAGIATTLEKFATTIRVLQRTEVGELEEEFGEKQVGSSTMPHKRNPITAEQICGIARVVRGFIGPALESTILWEERDLSNSSAERIILPEVSVLVDHILTQTIRVIQKLTVNEKRVRENMERLKGLNMAESVMIALTKKGASRQEAHEIVRKASMRAYGEDKGLIEVLLEDEAVMRYFRKEDLKRILLPENYLGTAKMRVETILEKAEKWLK